ncbi:MAG: exodeoxyribonuclease VII small subunit [Coriobacteriia bacterium]|nr:exodeoxyribonuclease VII small subunit [Coriobacteriia bacterium]
MSEGNAPSPEELSFGEALEELEGIVCALESGELELEESLARYERGVVLLRLLQAKLADAEQKVTTLVGELELENEDENEVEDEGEKTG